MSEESVNSRRCKGGNLFFSRILFCICLCGPVAYALAEESTVVSEIRQNEKKSISGVVTDTNDEPLIGATVLVKGTQNGTVTDVDGRFHLKVNSGETLVVSYIGMKSKEVAVVDGKKELFIRLDADTEMLDEVLVTGYQTLSKERSTGAFSKVSTEKLELKRMDNLSSMLEGQVAGYVNGQIRGVTTMNAVANPMVVIDGFPVENTTLDRIGQTTENMPDLNPEDIESISFLKDATASIYGMNSANGAVIVTTKKGATGKPRITLNANVGITSPTNVPEMANAGQYMTMRNEAEINAGRPAYITKDELTKWQQGAPGYESVDLYDAVFNKHATQFQTTLSLEGGTDKVSYYGSFGYATDNSLLKNNALTYDKYTFRSNVSLKITKDLTASINLGGRYDTTNRPWFPFYDIFKSTRVNPPTTSIYANDNPDYYNNFSYVPNPAAMIDADYTGSAKERNKNLQTQFALEYNIPYVKGLKVKGTFIYDYNNYGYKATRKGFKTYTYGEYTGEYTAADANYPALLQDNRRESERVDMQFQTNYNRTFGNHTIGATYVFERREEKANWMNGERKFDFFTIGELDNARESDQKVSGSSEHQAYLSHIGRLTYDYKGKYLAELACRYDGSYRYAPGSRWAFFPSASVGWRISEESFIKDNFKFVDNLKLRFSAGRSGQDAGDPFQYFSGYTLNSGGYVFSQGNYTNGVASPVMINKNLTWIKVNMYNIGIDFSIFNRLIAVEFDIYQRDRSGLLADRYGSLPNTFGSKLPQENLNGDRTRGIEFTLTHTNKIGDFHYSVSGNFNLARTQRRYIESGPYKSSMERWRNQASNRWGDFIWGYQTDGRFQNFDEINTYPIQNGDNGNSKELPGDYILKDVNGDGVVNDLDKTPLFWSGSPLIHYGFNVEASWKNFDFYALFQGSALYTVQFDEVYAKMLCFKGGNTPEYFYDRWHLSDPYDANSEWIPGEWPAIRLEQDMGSFYTRDSQIWRKNASYLRLKTIEIGYTFSPRLMHKLGIGSLRIYANGNNLFTVCDPFVKAFDPEKIEGDYSAGLNYPLNKSFNFGLTLNF